MSNPSPWPAFADEGAVLLVVSRYRVSEQTRAQFLTDADRAIGALAAQAGFRCASVGQAVDEAGLFVIRSEWDGVGAYRRALSAFAVKIDAVPLLSTAVDEPSAYEVVRHWTPEGRTSAPSGLAADAAVVGLGHAAAEHVPPVTS